MKEKNRPTGKKPLKPRPVPSANLTPPVSPVTQFPDFATLYAGIVRLGVGDYLKALAKAPDPALRCLRQALEQSRAILEVDHRQLPAQLIGRLPEGERPEVRKLLAEARAWQGTAWLCPVHHGLESVGGPLRHELRGHRDFIGALVFLPDRERLVSASEDGTLRLWHVPDGVLLRTFQDHTGPVNVLALTPDGTRLISGSDDTTIRIWNLDTWQVERVLTGHTGYVRDLRPLRDGRRIVSCSQDGTVRVWDLESGVLLGTLEGHGQWVNAVEVTLDGRLAFSSAINNDLKVWDLETLTELPPLFQTEMREFTRLLITDVFINTGNSGPVGHRDYAVKLALSPDGTRLYSVEHELLEWDIATRQQLRRLPAHGAMAEALALSPDGQWAVTGAENLKLWDLMQGQLLVALSGHSDTITAAAFSPDLRWLASGSRDRTIRLWDLPRLLHDSAGIVPPISVRGWAMAPNSRWVISGSNNGSATLWEVSSGRPMQTLAGHISSFVEPYGFIEGGKIAITGSHGGEITLWDTQTGMPRVALRNSVDEHYWINDVAVAPDGGYALVGVVNQPTALWELRAGAVPELLEQSAPHAACVAIAPDGRFALAGAYGRGSAPTAPLQAWDLVTRKLLWSVSPESEKDHTYFCEVRFNPDGQQVFAATSHGELYVLNPATGTVLARWKAHPQDYICAMHFCPDGRLWTAAINRDEMLELRLWDPAAHTLVRELRNSRSGARPPSFTADGRYAAFASHNAAVLWDLERDGELAAFDGDSSMVHVAITPDGETLFACEERERVHVLRVMRGNLQDT